MSKKLLGQKRPKPESDHESSEEEESEDQQPVKSIFGNANEQGFKPGLFGDLSKPTDKPVTLFPVGGASLFGNQKKEGEQKSLFGASLFGDKKGGSLFGDNKGGSLFGDNKSGSLFGDSKGGSLFGDNKGGSLFGNSANAFGNSSSLFSGIPKKEEDEEEEGNPEDDKIGKSNSPNPYNPEEKTENTQKDFKKLFVKKIDNFYLFNKEDRKYLTKGEGFISIETTEKENKKFAFVMFRNSIGNLLFEGILNDKFFKFDSYEKKFKFIAHFYFLTRQEAKEETDKKDEKKTKISYESGNAKIPFVKEEDCKTFGEKYNEAVEFLKK